MNDPVRRFKQQPWLSLFQVAGLTTLVTLLVEGLVVLGLAYSEVFKRMLEFLFSVPLGLILPLSMAILVGALGVYLCEFYFKQVYLNTSSLWALILCLIIGIGVKSLVPLPQLLVPFSYPIVMGMVLGVFWKGRSYWRW
jgi:hypothetical protein